MAFENGRARYSGRPVPSLQGLDAGGQVLFFGTFSKMLFPSLRLAYLVVPPDLVPHFTAAISVTRRHAPILDQAVLRDFIAEGHFGRHLRRTRSEIVVSRSEVVVSLSELFASRYEIVVSLSELFTTRSAHFASSDALRLNVTRWEYA